MNTQTGGEGETVQIQTQEQVTPEQFDVKIKTQEAPTEEAPVEPPVQRQMTEPEVIGAESTGGIADQEAFQGEPPALPGVEPTIPPSEDTEEDLEFTPYESPIDSEEDQDLPFNEYEDPLSFDYTFQNIPEEPLDKGVDNIIKFQSKFGLTEPTIPKVDTETKISNNSFYNPVASDFEKQITNGLDTDPESLKQAGIDFDLGSGTLISKEELDKKKAEIREDVAESDLKLAKQKSLDEYYSLVEKTDYRG